MSSLTYDRTVLRKAANSVVTTEDAAPGIVGYSGLSPFDIPQAVELEVVGHSRCVIRFNYPNAEPPEPFARDFPLDHRLQFTLGQNTKKILEIDIDDALSVFGVGPLDFDESVVDSWVDKEPSHVRITARLNARLVDYVLKAMPESLRSALIGDLADSAK